MKEQEIKKKVDDLIEEYISRPGIFDTREFSRWIFKQGYDTAMKKVDNILKKRRKTHGIK